MSAIREVTAELRAQTRMLQELHAMQLEQVRQLTVLRSKFDEGMGELEAGFAAVLAAVQTLGDRLPAKPPG